MNLPINPWVQRNIKQYLPDELLSIFQFGDPADYRFETKLVEAGSFIPDEAMYVSCLCRGVVREEISVCVESTTQVWHRELAFHNREQPVPVFLGLDWIFPPRISEHPIVPITITRRAKSSVRLLLLNSRGGSRFEDLYRYERESGLRVQEGLRNISRRMAETYPFSLTEFLAPGPKNTLAAVAATLLFFHSRKRTTVGKWEFREQLNTMRYCADAAKGVPRALQALKDARLVQIPAEDFHKGQTWHFTEVDRKGLSRVRQEGKLPSEPEQPRNDN